jgi:hypothetical protein
MFEERINVATGIGSSGKAAKLDGGLKRLAQGFGFLPAGLDSGAALKSELVYFRMAGTAQRNVVALAVNTAVL